MAKARKRRTKLEVITAIFTYIENQYHYNSMQKANLLKATDLNAKNIDSWLELIVFIQEQPKIIVQKIFQNYKGIFIPDSNIKSDYNSKTQLDNLEKGIDQIKTRFDNLESKVLNNENQ